jgi:hypothetical protein
MITLPEPPRLVRPTTDVRISYLTGEQADAVASGLDYGSVAPVRISMAAGVAEARRIGLGLRAPWHDDTERPARTLSGDSDHAGLGSVGVSRTQEFVTPSRMCPHSGVPGTTENFEACSTATNRQPPVDNES